MLTSAGGLWPVVTGGGEWCLVLVPGAGAGASLPCVGRWHPLPSFVGRSISKHTYAYTHSDARGWYGNALCVYRYMTTLIALARDVLGENIVLFTTDGGDTGYMTRGSIKGSIVYTVGDGCGNPQTCIDAQKAFNAPGMSPFMCSECYTGWLTHWGYVE